MEIELDRSRPTPIHLQIAQQVRQLILKGAISEGGRLPPTRRLAQALGVNRSTVVYAYNKLWSERLIEGHVGRGTIVREAERSREAPVSPLPWGMLLTSQMEASDAEIQELMRLFAREDLISFAAGSPRPNSIPWRGSPRLPMRSWTVRGTCCSDGAPSRATRRCGSCWRSGCGSRLLKY